MIEPSKTVCIKYVFQLGLSSHIPILLNHRHFLSCYKNLVLCKLNNLQGVLFHYSFHFVFFCHVLEVDYLRVATFVIGVSLFLLSRVLSSNPFFYYLTGITVGVSASILILVYFFIKLLPLKVSIYYLLCLRLKLNFGS